MTERRRLLRVLGGSATALLSGCTGPTGTVGESRDERDQQGHASGRGVQTPGDPEATPPSNSQKVDISLPGEPKRIRNGRLPVYEAERVVNSESEDFEDGLGRGRKSVSVGRSATEMSFSPEHDGTGQASGYATGTYRTAWTAPETGQYQLKSTFHRRGGFYYDLPRDGDVMTSFDVNVQVVNYDTSTVVANQRFPQSLQSSNQRSASAVGEFLIETAVTALLGYSLGLGLVGRIVLHQIVDELIQLDSPGGRGSEYDVAAVVRRENAPLNIGGPFEVTEGTTVVFEISPMLSWTYRLRDFHMRPRFDANFDMGGFWVKKLD